MDDKRKEIGQRIYTIRKRLKLSQGKFGEMIGVEGNTVSTYETGDSYPSLAVLVKIIEIANSIGPDRWLIMAKDVTTTSLKQLLAEEEFRLVKAFQQVSEADRRAILQVVESLAGNKTKGE